MKEVERQVLLSSQNERHHEQRALYVIILRSKFIITVSKISYCKLSKIFQKNVLAGIVASIF